MTRSFFAALVSRLTESPPTASEVLEFLDVDSPDKREGKVEELLTRSRYADYWGFRFRDWVTQIRQVKGQSTNLVTLYYYGRQAMAENRSWSRIASDLLATDGDVSQHGWANFALYFDTEPNEVADARLTDVPRYEPRLCTMSR